MVGKSTDHIEVAGADFIKSRDTPRKESFLVGDVETEALPDEKMSADPCREVVISFRVSVGFFRPKFIAEHGVEINAALQRLECPCLVQLLAPRNEVLLQGHRELALIG